MRRTVHLSERLIESSQSDHLSRLTPRRVTTPPQTPRIRPYLLQEALGVIRLLTIKPGREFDRNRIAGQIQST